MANPQKENGFTAISNELLEKIYQSKLALREMKIVLVVIRFTYGFRRKSAGLSLTFLSHATKIPLRHIQTTIKNLRLKNVLYVTSENRGSCSRSLQLNKDYDSWELGLTNSVNDKSSLPLTNPVNDTNTDSGTISNDQSSQPIKKIKKKTSKKCNPVSSIPDELRQVEGFSEIWENWVEFRKENKKPLTPTSVKLQFNKLIEFKVKGHDLVKIIENSIERGWQGFFEPKEFDLSNRNNGHKETHLDDF